MRLYKTEGKSISYSLLNILRLVLAGGVGLLALGDLGYWITRNYDTVDVLDPVLRALTMLLVIGIIQVKIEPKQIIRNIFTLKLK